MSYSQQHEIASLEAKSRALQHQIDLLTRPISMNDIEEMQKAQVRADSILCRFGKAIDPPTVAERPLDFRRRVVKTLAPYSPKFKDSRFDSLDAGTIGPVEDQVHSDAMKYADQVVREKSGTLRAVHETDPAGRTITKWVGDPMAWMRIFSTGGQVGNFVRPKQYS